MTAIEITRGDPRSNEAKNLLEQSHALMQSLYSPDECHYLEIDALCVESIHFFVAKLDGKTLGCAALANKGNYGEIKSMFVDPAARGSGIANRLMTTLIEDAKAQGLSLICLETGDVLAAAHKLYERHGFVKCGPFGDYVECDASVFMKKTL
ncbi:MAG: GNAT family N-acetyltransferase [Pseudomonadota bacterium]|nr:GNAT family N-acetyltransferase [Pseudomonadota bacterium]